LGIRLRRLRAGGSARVYLEHRRCGKLDTGAEDGRVISARSFAVSPRLDG
jgi:hypothetical protein